MKVTFAISLVAIFGLVGFMTDPLWEAMALWQKQVWILSMAAVFLALMVLFAMFHAGMRPRNLRKEDELVKESQISILSDLARHRISMIFMYLELGRLNRRYRYLNEQEYRRIERYRRKVHDDFQINQNETT
tara:strand:- start:266 stop:661 length:396 start_codon:yes stop_codon:yes gene_type:complete